MLRVPGSVPVGVIEMAHLIDANLTDESERAMLWRLVEHPDMIGVWSRLRKMDARGRLGEFFQKVFWHARGAPVVLTLKDIQPQLLTAKYMARTLRLFAKVPLINQRKPKLDGTREEVSEADRKDAAVLLEAAQYFEAYVSRAERFFAKFQSVVPGMAKHRPGDPRAGMLADAILDLCEDYFGQRIRPFAATITNVALDLSGKNRVTKDALRVAQARDMKRKRANTTTKK
jgi:hypothetical protein